MLNIGKGINKGISRGITEDDLCKNKVHPCGMYGMTIKANSVQFSQFRML